VGGLPAHPLIVHVAVILVPLAAIGLLATGWRSSWRRRYALPLVLIAGAGAVAAFLAAQSGEALEQSVRQAARVAGARADLGDHPEDGQRAEQVAFLLAAVTLGVWVIDGWWERWRLPHWAPRAAYLVAVVPSLAAILVMVSAGHSGAALVWKDLGNYVTQR
jgi:hypothetical protein